MISDGCNKTSNTKEREVVELQLVHQLPYEIKKLLIASFNIQECN